MALPSLDEVQIAVLQELQTIGRSVPWKDVSKQVASRLSVSPVDLAQTTKGGKNFWDYRRIKLARGGLRKQGYITVGGGIWAITNAGIQYLTPQQGQQGTMIQLIRRAGGEAKLAILLDLVNKYTRGDISESDLTKGIRRLRAGQ